MNQTVRWILSTLKISEATEEVKHTGTLLVSTVLESHWWIILSSVTHLSSIRFSSDQLHIRLLRMCTTDSDQPPDICQILSAFNWSSLSARLSFANSWNTPGWPPGDVSPGNLSVTENHFNQSEQVNYKTAVSPVSLTPVSMTHVSLSPVSITPVSGSCLTDNCLTNTCLYHTCLTDTCLWHLSHWHVLSVSPVSLRDQ